MRKLLLYSALLTLLFSSCKKEHNKAPDPPKYKVNFNVSGFTQQIVGSVKGKQKLNSLQTNTVPLDTAIKALYYVVFDANRNVVSRITQSPADANFGSITDNLPTGTYSVVFAGGDQNLLLSTQNDAGTVPYLRGETYSTPWGDTFFKKITLTVTGGDVSQNVSLDRVVGKLTINLEDALPANASYITVNPSVEFSYFPLLDPLTTIGPVGGPLVKFIIPASAIGNTNYKMSMLMMNTSSPFTVTISCYDSANTLIAQVMTSSVTLAVNTQTILSGKLFGSSNGINTGLNIWDPTPITVHF